MKNFRERCEEVADELGIELIDVYEDSSDQDSFEDDGILHVMHEGKRYAFDVSNNQNLDRVEQNELTIDVLNSLNIPVTKRVLV